jgi:hypothetical protein
MSPLNTDVARKSPIIEHGTELSYKLLSTARDMADSRLPHHSSCHQRHDSAVWVFSRRHTTHPILSPQ